MGKRHLYRSNHPIDAFPFEAFYFGSWKTVEFMRIRDGTITMHFVDSGFVIEERSPISNLRIRSRRATLFDCTCFLRPGIDICVLSTIQHTESSGEENPELVWVDAKISSIERKPHESRCTCQFYINFYVSQDPFGTEKGTLGKEINIVEIDQVSILQKLERDPSENEQCRWNYAENCSSLQRAKLFLGKFSSDLSWLVVVSVLKQIVFDVRSIQNKIVYQILDGDHDKCPLNSDKHLNAVNFRLDNGISIPTVVPFVPVYAHEARPICDMREAPLSFYDLMDLRRSKRRNVQPERYFGDGAFTESDIGLVRTETYKTDKWEDEEMSLALLNQSGIHANCSEKHIEGEKRICDCELDSFESFLVPKSKIKSREVKSGVDNRRVHQTHLGSTSLPCQSDPMAHEQDHLHSVLPVSHSGEIGEFSSKYYYRNSNPTVQRKNISEVTCMDVESRWEGKGSNKKLQGIRNYYFCSKTERFRYRKRSLNASVYKEVIKTYMKKIESTIKKEEPLIIDQWKEIQATNCLNQGRVSNITSSVEDEGESSETEMLWREMELSIASTYLLEDNEGSNVEVSTEVVKKSSKGGGHFCQHEYRLDEEIGILCQLCGYVSTEIKDVAPPFVSQV